MADIAVADITAYDAGADDITAYDVPSLDSTIEWASDMLSLSASTGDAWSMPSVGDSAGNRLTLDFESRWIPVKAEELRQVGMRRVENLITKSEDLTNAAWSVSTGATKTNATTITFDGTANAELRQLSVGSLTAAIGDKFIVSLYVTLVSGTPSSDAAVQFGFSSTSGGFSADSLADIGSDVSGTQKRFSYAATADAAGDLDFIFRCDDSAVFTITKVQVEKVTGQTNQNPSEYVSTGVLSSPYHGWNTDGVKYFSYENGNTVSSNVVTEAQGSAISASTIKGAFFEGAATELSGASADLTNATYWALYNGGPDSTAKDATGLSGASNEAFTISRTSTDTWSRSLRRVLTITSGSSTYYAVFRVGYEASPTSYPAFQISLTGGTSRHQNIIIDRSDGSYVSSSTDGAVVSVTRRQGPFDHWEIILSVTDNSSGNNQSTLWIWPCRNLDGSTATNDTATGSCVVASAELYKTYYSFSPILTTGGTTKTRLSDASATLPFTWANVDAAGSVEFTFTPHFIDALASNGGVITPNASDLTKLIYIPTTAKAITIADGTNTDTATTAWATVSDTTAIKMRWGSSTMQFSVDGSAQGSTSFDGSFNGSGAVTLFKSLLMSGAIKDVTFHNTDLGDGWLTE